MHTISPLFNQRFLQQAVSAAPEPTPDQLAVATRWARAVRKPSFLRENEKPHQGAFLSGLFGGALGYGQLADAAGSLAGDASYHLVAESASAETKGGKTSDAQISFFGASSGEGVPGRTPVTRAVVELRAPGADLDTDLQDASALLKLLQLEGSAPTPSYLFRSSPKV